MMFSVIIPTFNRSQYLKESLQSVLKQKNVVFEVIVIDNASSDNTSQMMQEFSFFKEVKYIRNDTNIGMIPNWSKALYNYCHGEWVLILSDDDLLIDDYYLYKAQRIIEEDKHVVLIHANRIVLTDTLEKKKARVLPKICDGKWMFEHYLETSNNMFTFVTGIFKKDIAFKVNAFKTFDVVGSDTMEFLKMSLYGKVGFIKDFVAKYRMHDNNPYYRFGIDYILGRNLETFEAPYREALKLKIFDEPRLSKWKKRLILQYIESNLVEILTKSKGDFSLLREYLQKIFSVDSVSWYIMFKPKIVVRFLSFICTVRK